MRIRRLSRRGTVSLVLAVAGVVMLGGTALAGHVGNDVTSYTGCLASGKGTITKVMEGDVPNGPCTAGMVEVHLSGGDISKVAVTGALTGGGDNGEVTIGLKPEFTLPGGCDLGRVAEWNGSAWVCGVDDDTTYSAGTGLALSGTTFSVAPDHRVKNTPDCSSGQFATGFDASGNVQCAAPPAALQAFEARQVNFLPGDGVPDDGNRHTFVTLDVPAGTYLVTGKGVLSQGDDDIPSFDTAGGNFGCELGNLPDESTRFFGQDNDPGEYPFAMTGVVTTSGSPITLRCWAGSDYDRIEIRNATLAAARTG